MPEQQHPVCHNERHDHILADPHNPDCRMAEREAREKKQKQKQQA